MSTTAGSGRKRAPAMLVNLPQEMPLHFKQIDHTKVYDTRGIDGDHFDYWGPTTRLDIVQVPPVLESPKLIQVSLFQPIVRWGFRQWNRGHMTARPRFSERYVLVGRLVKQATMRAKMDGVNTRQAGGGYVYVYPQFFTGNRAVTLEGPPSA